MVKRIITYRPAWLGAILLLSLIWAGYSSSAPSDRWPEPDTKLNPDFVKHPPIAQSVTLDVLDTPEPSGANVILSATFDGPTRKRINGKYLAMTLTGDGTASQLDFLRDDGYDGDEKPGDGRYTKSFKVSNKAEVTGLVDALISTAKMPHNAYTFKNRVMVPSADIATLVTSRNTPRGKQITMNPGAANKGTPPNPDFIDHSLMITDLSVVEDPIRTYNPCTNTGNPNGAWTFGELMRQLASPNAATIASDAQTIIFIKKWLNTWNNPQIVNGELVPARPSASIINTWINLSAANGAGPGQVLLENVPFRLMAIVNRVDLRGQSGYGPSDAGEARMVFALLNDNCDARRMTVIFEYGVNRSGCQEVLDWANAWASLAGFTFPDPSFNDVLNKITDQFTLSGTNSKKPNESSINQVRTNELAIGAPWELREFNLFPGLNLVTVKQEPALKYNVQFTNADVTLLANWVNANTPAILANNYIVPDNVAGFDFLGGKSQVTGAPVGPPSPGVPGNPHHWDGDAIVGSAGHIINKDARFQFSVNTCSGCHAGETQTFFTHIDPTGWNAGIPAPLSRFLTGAPGLPLNDPFMVDDAAGRPTFASPDQRGFNDLWRRAEDLQDLIDTPCSSLFVAITSLLTEPLSGTH